MDKIIAFCGLVCTECPAFIATINDDDKEREKIAKQWAKEFKHEFKIEDINCDGCLSTKGRHIGYCNICEIRSCATGKKVKNCAYCEDYLCEKLNNFLKMAPHAAKSLDEIRKNI
jgi:hypothetical protein